MKIFAISGLGADKRVFDFLQLDNELIPLDWVSPIKNETIEDYSLRLAQKYKIDRISDFVILGLSFGGLIAVEISKILKPKLTILISSAETKKELHNVFKIIGKFIYTKKLPEKMFDPPRKIAHYIFNTKKTKLLDSILDDTDLGFSKWAVNELLNWKNTSKIENILKICGEYDRLMPPKDKKNSIIIKKGTHFMIVDNADEINKIINDKMKTL